uniref:GH84 domain-containing protein n=1 Tax=Buteo japonicus TaxID=224669 RepID=A0A8C0HRW4_9AVES
MAPAPSSVSPKDPPSSPGGCSGALGVVGWHLPGCLFGNCPPGASGDPLSLLHRLKRWGLNCYMYAPKDELKHRLLWREPYTEHEAGTRMRSLIEAAQEQGVEFVFAISAGQDMVFSSAGDRLLLQEKLRQVAAMGCQSFALLFDDIDPCMCQADRDVFPSLAQAQASVANEVYQELGQPSVFLFCPTGTACSRAAPATPGTPVLGPKVVSQELSAMQLEEVEGVLRRRPVIWDNLYANDYDCRRVFLGPYMGRAPGLMSRLHGLLLNPNCELQANFIPIHTLGSWFRSELRRMETVTALEDSQGSEEGSYSPQDALELALHDWVAEINRQAGSGPVVPLTPKETRTSPTAPVTPEEAKSRPMTPVTAEEARFIPTAPLTSEDTGSVPTALMTLEEARSNPTAPLTPEEARSSPMAPLTLGEVRMLVELFYLPYHHGPLAQHLLEHFRWLRANSLSVGVPATATEACGVSCADRQALLYDLHPYLWDIRNMLLAASAFILWLEGPSSRCLQDKVWSQNNPLPDGLCLFQALLPVGNSCDLFYHPPPLFPSSQLYLLRPLLPLDKEAGWSELSLGQAGSRRQLSSAPALAGRLLGSFLSLSPEYTFVLEDEGGLCGYAAGALCAEGFLQQRDSSWLPAIRHKYPRDLGGGAPALGQVREHLEQRGPGMGGMEGVPSLVFVSCRMSWTKHCSSSTQSHQLCPCL